MTHKLTISGRTWAVAAMVGVTASSFLALPFTAANAQFGGLLGRSRSQPSNSDQTPQQACEAATSSGTGGVGRSILRGALGAATSRLGRVGNLTRFIPTAAVADTLTNAIACRLDEGEQLKAKEATDQVTTTETVGSSVAWRSDTREGVTGTSTIVAVEDGPSPDGPGNSHNSNAIANNNANANANANAVGGYRCMLVDDVIIVNGEETREQKRMCRIPPSTRYTLSA